MNTPTKPPVHWSMQKEQSSGYWHFKFLLILFRIFPVIILRLLAFPVGLCYFLFSKRSRAESKRFLQKAAPFIYESDKEKKCCSVLGPLRHIISFALCLVEKIQSWSGKFPFKNIHFQDDDIQEIIAGLENGKGALLICSHLGNAELLRALASFNRTGVSTTIGVTSIIDMEVTVHFSRMLRELNPHYAMDFINARAIHPDTAILLEEKLAAGELVVIAGDRTSAGASALEGEKQLRIPFLGEDAPFSPGVFYLAALLKAPVYFVFALRRRDVSLNVHYNMHVHKSNISFDCSRKERLARSSELARCFASLLENYCKNEPFQWYNFFDFWAKGE